MTPSMEICLIEVTNTLLNYQRYGNRSENFVKLESYVANIVIPLPDILVEQALDKTS